MWRVLTRQNKSITISFLPAGHTKFSPDWCFGLVKQTFRKAEVGCLNEIATVVEESASVNIAQLVGTQEGELIVPTYSWSSFLSQYFKRIPGIKKIHHFIIHSPEPSEIQLKQSVDSSTVKMTLLRSPSVIPPDTLPPVISPRGLSPERQWYLFDKIREYCRLQLQDITCPLPDVPRAFTPCPSPEPDFVTQGNSSPLHRTQTRPRVCGLCGISGHNRRTCPNGESTS